jgi:CysZ protein
LVILVLKPMLLAIAQFDDPVFLGVVLRSLAWAALAMAALLVGTLWGVHHLLASEHWAAGWSWLATLLGGIGVALLAVWLFLPVAAVIGAFYVDRIAAAVERRFYPDLPPPRPASAWTQAFDALAVGLHVLGMSVVSLVLAVVLPGVGIVLAWLISAWAIGRGLFGAVALRRMRRRDVRAAYRRRRLAVLAQGGLLALAGIIPPFNLLVPVLGTAAMVHVLHGGRSRPVAKSGG